MKKEEVSISEVVRKKYQKEIRSLAHKAINTMIKECVKAGLEPYEKGSSIPTGEAVKDTYYATKYQISQELVFQMTMASVKPR